MKQNSVEQILIIVIEPNYPDHGCPFLFLEKRRGHNFKLHLDILDNLADYCYFLILKVLLIKCAYIKTYEMNNCKESMI